MERDSVWLVVMILCGDRIGGGEAPGRCLFAGPWGSGAGDGGRRVEGVFGRAAVPGEPCRTSTWRLAGAGERRRDGAQVGRRAGAEACAYDEALRAQVAQKGDITLVELQAWLAGDHAVKASVGCLWARIRHLGLTLKKSRNAPRAGSCRRSGSSRAMAGAAGRMASGERTILCLSTRPAPRPR